MLLTCGILAAALSHLPALANDYDIVTMEEVQAIELVLIPAKDLAIAPSNQTNYPTIDNAESLEVASIEQPGGAVLAYDNAFNTEDKERPNNDGYTATAYGAKTVAKQEWYASAIPFRLLC